MFVSVSPPSRKRFATPAHWCNAGDVGGEGGGEEGNHHFVVSDIGGGSIGQGRHGCILGNGCRVLDLYLF